MSSVQLPLGTWSKAKHAAYYSAITVVLLIDVPTRILWPSSNAAAAPFLARLLNLLIPTTAILCALALCYATFKAKAIRLFPLFNIAFSMLALCDFVNLHFRNLNTSPTAQPTWFLHTIMWQLWLSFMDVPPWGLLLWQTFALPLLLLADQDTLRAAHPSGACMAWGACSRLARGAGLCAATLAMPLLLHQMTKRPAPHPTPPSPPPPTLHLRFHPSNPLGRIAILYLQLLAWAEAAVRALPVISPGHHTSLIIFSCSTLAAVQGSVSVLQAVRGEAQALYPMILLMCGYLLGSVEGQLGSCIQRLMEQQLRAAQELLYDLLPRQVVSALLEWEDGAQQGQGSGAPAAQQQQQEQQWQKGGHAADAAEAQASPWAPFLSAPGVVQEISSANLRRISLRGTSLPTPLDVPCTCMGPQPAAAVTAAESPSSERATWIDSSAAIARQDSSSSCPSTIHLGPRLSQRAVPAEPPLAMFHDSVTVFFCDIVSFSTISRQVPPEQVMAMLNDLFSRFDAISVSRPVYKVETIGDSYMAATGLLHNDPHHVLSMVEFAIAIQQAAAQVQNPCKPDEAIEIRVGIHSGSCLSGIVGRLRKRYCLFGDTVNTASRMESTGLPGRIHISSHTYHLLQQQLQQQQQQLQQLQQQQQQQQGGGPAAAAAAAAAAAWEWECRGSTDVKGLGPMITYLMSPLPSTDTDDSASLSAGRS